MITIGDAVLWLKAQDSQLKSDLAGAGQEADSWAQRVGSSVNSILKVGVTAALGGVTALVGGLIGATKVAGDWANTLDGLGDVLGTDARHSAALAVAIENVGGNVDAVTAQFTFLARGLETAKGQLGPTGLELQKLGVNVYDASGNLKDVTAIASDVADVFSKMPDGIEKSALMTRVMGRSGKDLSDVMNELANGGLARADEKARKLGLSMSDEAVAGFVAFDKQMVTIQQTLKGVAVTIGTAVLPFITRAGAAFMDWLGNPLIKRALDEISIALGLIGDGHVWSGIIHIGEAFGFTEGQMTPLADAFKTLQAFLFTKLVPAFNLIKFAITDFGDAIFYHGDEPLGLFAGDLQEIAKLFGISGDAAFAFGMALGAMAVSLTSGNGISESLGGALEQVPPLLQSVGDMLGPVIQGWADIAGPALGDFVSGIVTYLSANLPLWIQAFAQFELAAWAWIEQAVPPLLAQANLFFNALVTWVASQIPIWTTALGALVAPAVAWILDALPGLAANLGVFTGQLLAFVLQLAIDLAGALLPLAWQFVSWIITDVLPQLPGALQQIDAAIVLFLLGLITSLAPTLVALGARFVSWVTDPGGPADQIGGKLEAFKKAMVTWITTSTASISKDFNKLGSDVMDALGKGITDAINELIRRLNSVIQALKDAFASGLKMFSPSHVFMDYGRNLMEGLALGIEKGALLPQLALNAAVPSMSFAGASAGSGAGATSAASPAAAGASPERGAGIVIHAVVNNQMDIEDLAYRVYEVGRRKGW